MKKKQYYFMLKNKITLSLHAPTWSWSGWSLGPADIPRKQLKMFSTQSWFVLQVRSTGYPELLRSSWRHLNARIWHRIPLMNGSGFLFSLKTRFRTKNSIFSRAACCWASKTPNADRRPSRKQQLLLTSNHWTHKIFMDMTDNFNFNYDEKKCLIFLGCLKIF